MYKSPRIYHNKLLRVCSELPKSNALFVCLMQCWETEPRASHMLSKNFTTELLSLPPNSIAQPFPN